MGAPWCVCVRAPSIQVKSNTSPSVPVDSERWECELCELIEMHRMGFTYQSTLYSFRFVHINDSPFSFSWLPNARLSNTGHSSSAAGPSGSGNTSGDGDFSNFVEGLGPGQIVGRQALASPSLGDIQLSLQDRKGNLEVEVIRARGLQPKPGSKILPGT